VGEGASESDRILVLFRGTAPVGLADNGRPGPSRPGRGTTPTAKGVSETYQYLVSDVAFHYTVDDGAVELRDGSAHHPAVVVTTDEETYADVVSGRITASSAVSMGALTFRGDAQATQRLRRIFSRHGMASGRRSD
jgi:putative sterol carrier protein